MKMLKKFFSLTVALIITFGLIGISTIKAESNTVYSENGKGSWTLTSEENQNIYGMTHRHVHGLTDADVYVNDQQVNIFEMKTDGVYSKLVNWAYQSSPNTYERKTIMEIAEDYEEKHPGWIVLGGINADQYAMTKSYGGSKSPFFPQPFYPVIIDGERRFVTGLFGGESMFMGFANDGSENPFVAESALLGYYACIIDDNDKEIGRIYIEGFNQAPSATGTTVWMPYMTQSGSEYICPSVSGNKLYVVEQPELQYVSNCPDYGVKYAGFGKGTISQITNQFDLSEAQFLLESNDPNVESFLAVGTKIIVQGVYEDERLNEVESSAGFHSAQRLNDKDVEATASYDSQTYSRSIFGRKADGTYALVTIDLFNNMYKGMTQDESNALLKSYGIVEAYQQDGGGSVTACVRNEIGTFDLVNKPKDGGTRTVFNGLFFVVRDPGFTTNTINNTRTSINVIKTETVNSSLVKNAYATINGVTKPLSENTTEFTGLTEDTSYDVTYTFDMYDEKTDSYKTCSYTTVAKTKAFEIPSSGYKITTIDKKSITFTREDGPYTEHMSNVVLDLANFTYDLTGEEVVVIDELIEDTEYSGVITYQINDPESGNVYYGREEIKFETLKYAQPVIEKFEQVRLYDDKVIFGYTYKDPDNAVSSAYLYYNKEKIELTSKSGNITVENLDFSNVEYKFYILLAYDDGKSTSLQKLSSEEIILGTQSNRKTITYVLDGGTLPSDAPTSYEVGVGTELPTPTKEGYIFKGWYSGSTLVEAVTSKVKVNLTLTAHWEEDPNYVPPTGGDDTPSEGGGSSCSMGSSIKNIISLSAALSLLVIAIRKRK